MAFHSGRQTQSEEALMPFFPRRALRPTDYALTIYRFSMPFLGYGVS
jgi:hypothetical protein